MLPTSINYEPNQVMDPHKHPRALGLLIYFILVRLIGVLTGRGSESQLQLENAVFRHQVRVLRRSVRSRSVAHLHLHRTDKLGGLIHETKSQPDGIRISGEFGLGKSEEGFKRFGGDAQSGTRDRVFNATHFEIDVPVKQYLVTVSERNPADTESRTIRRGSDAYRFARVFRGEYTVSPIWTQVEFSPLNAH